MTESEFTLTVYNASVRPEPRSEAVALYREVYAESPYLEGEEDFRNFADDLERRIKQQSFRLVVARYGAKPLGFAMGHQLSASTRWWEGALTRMPVEITQEYRGRTFAVIELAVLEAHRRSYIGRQLHAHLLADLPEQRATLLVRPEALPAVEAYTGWGYRNVGQVRPDKAAPVYNAMVRPLS